MNNLAKLVLIFLLTSSAHTFSQTKEDALIDAKTLSSATLDLNFKTVLKHTLPIVVDMMGGKDRALTALKSSFDGMKAQGFIFEKATINSVSEIVKEQDQYRCVVKSFNQIMIANQRIKSYSYLLGIYNKADSFWWFIEAKQLKNKAILDEVLPNFKTSLEILEDEVVVEAIED